MEFATVPCSVDAGIARIVMNRPDKRDALNHQLLDDIDAAFTAADADDSVASSCCPRTGRRSARFDRRQLLHVRA